MIKVENIVAGYGTKMVLKDVTASAKPGQLIALLGPNGSGKSTLLKTISGLIKPINGHVMFNSKDVHAIHAKQRAKHIAYLAQGREAAPGLLVSDILEIGRSPYRGRLGKISHEGHAAIHRAAEHTQITKFMARRFENLSGGEQARVLLARALVVEAPVLLADEPIAALDPFFQISTMEILQAEAQNGKLVIAALHDLALAHQYADQVWIMHEGQIAVTGTPKEALNVETLKTVFSIEPPRHGFQHVQRA